MSWSGQTYSHAIAGPSCRLSSWEVRGKIERDGLVIHIIANELIDHTHQLRALGEGERRCRRLKGNIVRDVETQKPGFPLMKQPHEMRPGNRYARERGEGSTLGELVRANMALVAICHRCKHRRLIYPANLIPRFGEGYPAIQLPSACAAPAAGRAIRISMN